MFVSVARAHESTARDGKTMIAMMTVRF